MSSTAAISKSRHGRQPSGDGVTDYSVKTTTRSLPGRSTPFGVKTVVSGEELILRCCEIFVRGHGVRERRNLRPDTPVVRLAAQTSTVNLNTPLCAISPTLQDFNIALVGYALCIGKTSCDSLDLGLTELNGEASASAHSSQASMKRRMTQPPSEDAAELHMLRRGAHARAAL